jgi:hypothetical protein
MGNQHIFKLSGDQNEGVTRFLSVKVDTKKLSEKKTVVLTVTRTGKFYDPRYGEFAITNDMLLSMVNNFESGVYGQDIVLDVAHNHSNGAAGFFRRLFLDRGRLRAEVELTEYGIDAIKNKGFVYVSAEFHNNFKDNEERKEHGPTLLGAGLTARPVIKHLDRVQLSEAQLDGEPMTLISEHLIKQLSEDIQMDKFLKLLRDNLVKLELAEENIKQLTDSFKLAAEPLGDDEDKLKALADSFEASGKKLAEAVGDQVVTLSIQTPAAAGLSRDDILAVVTEANAAQAQTLADAAKKLSDNQAEYESLIQADDGLKALSDDQLNFILEAKKLITADSTSEQINALAEQQIKLGNQISIGQQLAMQGYQIAGNAHISVDDSNNVKSLQETIDKRLGYAGLSDSQRYADTGGTLQAANKEMVERVLAEYDANPTNAQNLRAEHKMLAGGAGDISDVTVPAVVERTVIRESLYMMKGLGFVNYGTMQFANSGTLPYSYRDITAAGKDATRVYEGQEIQRAGIKQVADTVYPIPQKLAFQISNELSYLTRSGLIDFDAAIENVRNASRIIGEDSDTLIFNEIQQSNDEFGAVAVADEDIPGADIDGTNNVFVLANFPVVHPRTRRDLQGNIIGSTLNPITVQYNSGSGLTTIEEFDGTGTQAAGFYYTLDYNEGEFYITDESGAIVVPANTHALRVSYSYTTNAYKFDTFLNGADVKAHWNNFLYRYGLRKTEMNARLRTTNFGLMSETVMNQIEQAEQFIANYSKPGTDLTADGSLGRIKAVPNTHTTAPGLWMGDQRIFLGERNQTRFRMMKPWAMGELQDQRGPNGRFTGQKEAYGEQFIVLHTPEPLKNATTSMVLYNSNTRAARVM